MPDNMKTIDRIPLLEAKIEDLKNRLVELDKQIFYLKTLYDVNREISPLNNTDEIMKAFLMMIMGTFGVFEGFIILMDRGTGKLDSFEYRFLEEGISQQIFDFFQNSKWGIFQEKPLSFFDQKLSKDLFPLHNEKQNIFNFLVSKGIFTFVPFIINGRFSGAIALGKKMTEESFSQVDQELLDTLSNQLAINIKNAKSFDIIQGLNNDLRIKNKALERNLKKIELLEKAKALLCKFVPKSLERIIENHPDTPDLDKKEQDISVLFLDIEGYTAISEELKYEQITGLLETYFSRFLDDIHRYDGDINMSSGDGLMIIFHNKDKNLHAANAVNTALAIRKKTNDINRKVKESTVPLVINIGIHSGLASVGATRLEGYYGSRWTYTALGSTVNVAARIGSFAKNGEILVSQGTESRIKDTFPLEFFGTQKFKNVKNEISLYKVIGDHFS